MYGVGRLQQRRTCVLNQFQIYMTILLKRGVLVALMVYFLECTTILKNNGIKIVINIHSRVTFAKMWISGPSKRVFYDTQHCLSL